MSGTAAVVAAGFVGVRPARAMTGPAVLSPAADAAALMKSAIVAISELDKHAIL